MVELTTVPSPIGPLALAARNGRVCLLQFERRVRLKPDATEGRTLGLKPDATEDNLARWYPGESIVGHQDPGGAATVLRAYFGGDLDALDRIPVELNGTPFQQQVWEALRRIRAGTTAAYAEIARTIGVPSAVRAVGAANAANPVAVIVPCHRIIGSNGSLTGYGGGLDRKRWLLQHEGCLLL